VRVLPFPVAETDLVKLDAGYLHQHRFDVVAHDTNPRRLLAGKLGINIAVAIESDFVIVVVGFATKSNASSSVATGRRSGFFRARAWRAGRDPADFAEPFTPNFKPRDGGAGSSPSGFGQG
jgi:hypothetical protein